MANAFVDLIESFRRGRRSVFSLGPFLPIESLWRNGWKFNQILQESEAMAQAAGPSSSWWRKEGPRPFHPGFSRT